MVLFAAEPWKNKDYTQWTDDEINKVLTDSPWAKEMTVAPQGSGYGRGAGLDSRAADTRVEDIQAAVTRAAVTQVVVTLAVATLAVGIRAVATRAAATQAVEGILAAGVIRMTTVELPRAAAAPAP